MDSLRCDLICAKKIYGHWKDCSSQTFHLIPVNWQTYVANKLAYIRNSVCQNQLYRFHITDYLIKDGSLVFGGVV